MFIPVVQRMRFPEKLQKLLVNKKLFGYITILDSECAGMLSQWLALGFIVTTLKNNQSESFWNITPTVMWASKMASQKSVVSGILLRALALQQSVNHAYLLITIFIPGVENNLPGIPSRKFGKIYKWYYSCNKKFLSMFNTWSSLSQVRYWIMFHFIYKFSTQLISELLMYRFTKGIWVWPPCNIGSVGVIFGSTAYQST